MPAYQSATGGTIGALLRQIQEEKNAQPLATPPSSDTSSPIRGLVQQPLQQVEAPDSSRVISVRPDTQPLSGGGDVPAVVPSAAAPVQSVGTPSVVGANYVKPAEVAGVPGVAPVPTPVPTPSPVQSQPSSVPASKIASVSAPSLATKITNAPSTSRGSVKGTSTKVSAPNPSPTPAPRPPNPTPVITRVPTPGHSSVGPIQVKNPLDLLKGYINKLAQQILPRA